MVQGDDPQFAREIKGNTIPAYWCIKKITFAPFIDNVNIADLSKQ